MKKIIAKYEEKDSGKELVRVELTIDEIDQDNEMYVNQAAEELVRYVLRLKGIVSPGCQGCCGCGGNEDE